MDNWEKTMTDLEGVYTSGMHCGVKRKALDLAYIYVPNATGSAGVFTKNLFCAPSIQITRKQMKYNTLKAMIVNSGCSNVATGEIGNANAKKMIRQTAKKLGLESSEVGVAQTGIIGVQLKMDKIEPGIDSLLDDIHQKDTQKAAQAILTTDTFPKSVYVTKKIGKKEFVVSGIAKGSGMLKPNMATMLAFLVTNADLNSDQLQGFFSKSIDKSFNAISVDTDTSTSDMAVMFATGQHRFDVKNTEEVAAFQELMDEACIKLAKLVVKDGEGASKLIEVSVEGAASNEQAKQIAFNVVDSPLVKTAIHGEDPNWGRIIMAIGKDPEMKVNPNKVMISIGGIPIFDQGQEAGFSGEEVKAYLSKPEVTIQIDLNIAKGHARVWGCDLTQGYITINTKYN